MVYRPVPPQARLKRILPSLHLFWRRAVLASGFGPPAGANRLEGKSRALHLGNLCVVLILERLRLKNIRAE